MMYANCKKCGTGYWCDVEGPISGLCSKCQAERFRTTPVAADAEQQETLVDDDARAAEPVG